MSKGKAQKMTRNQRQNRTYQVVFIIFCVIVVLTMVLSLIK